MTISNLDLLASYINDNGQIELTEELKYNIKAAAGAEFYNSLFNENRNFNAAEGYIGSYNPFRTTPRSTARDGKGLKPADQKDNFINGWHVNNKENRVYRKDPIPLSVYTSMSYDTKIKLATQLIIGFMTRLQFDIVSSDPKKKALVEHCINPIYNQLVTDMVRFGLRNGFMFGEKVWERRTVKVYDKATNEQIFSGRAVVPVKIKTLDPCNNFSYWVDSKTDELVRVEQIQGGKTVWTGRNKVFWFAYNKEYSNIFGVSAYRAAYQSWHFANGLEQAMLMKLDTTGEPILVVRFPKGRNNMNGQFVENDVIASEISERVQYEKTLILPSEVDKDSGVEQWSIDYIELKNADNDPYLKTIEFFDKKKVEALGIFGNIIAGEANFSEIDAKEDLTVVMIEALVDQVERTLQEDLVDWITSYNFGPKHLDDVRIHIDRNSLGRMKMLKDLFTEMLRISASEKNARPKKMPDLDRMAHQLGIPMTLYSSNMERTLIDDQMKAEKAMQPKPAPVQPGVGPKGQPADQVKQQQRNEDSNNKNRKTEQVRNRPRPSAQERLK